jgi:hypothetical protein
MSVRVFNLATGEERIYDWTLTPVQAVRNAWLQTVRGDFNTWDYENRTLLPMRVTGRTVSCGDWVALL